MPSGPVRHRGDASLYTDNQTVQSVQAQEGLQVRRVWRTQGAHHVRSNWDSLTERLDIPRLELILLLHMPQPTIAAIP